MSIVPTRDLTIPPPDSRLRLVSGLYGLLLFVWLSPEESAVWPVALLGVGFTVLSLMWMLRRRFGRRTIRSHMVIPTAVVTGVMVGASSAAVTAGLMFFKNSLHAHVFWDFPPAMMAAMLPRAGSWGAAGGLAGFGLGCLWMWHKSGEDNHRGNMVAKRLVNEQVFAGLWIAGNLAGFMIGGILGATNQGVIARIWGESMLVRILGDLVFGGCFGVAQYLVLQHWLPRSRERLMWWIPLCMIGFTLGARLGARFAPIAGSHDVLLGMVFGLVMGLCVGGVQWFGMRYLGVLNVRRPALWIPISVLAWVAGESISFEFQFRLMAVPLVALAIALVSGIGLLWWIEPEQ